MKNTAEAGFEVRFMSAGFRQGVLNHRVDELDDVAGILGLLNEGFDLAASVVIAAQAFCSAVGTT